MKLAIKKASTDVTVYLFIQDSSKTTGEGLTGLAYNTASLVASYVRPLAARAALSLATQTVTGAHSDGGFVEIDSTNMPGVYRLDLSDAVCATGVNSVVVMLKGAANMAPLLLEIQLTDFDLNDASPNVTVADIANDAITAAAYDESTAYPVKSADTGATQIARVGADSDTLETLSDEIAAVKAETALIVADTGTDGVKLAADQAVDVTKIGGQAISGNNATLKLKALDIQNSDGNAVNLVSTGSNGNGLMAVGNGNGAGAGFTGGETGMGLYAIGGTTSGHGVYASGRGATSSDGMVAQSTQRRGFSMSGAVQGLLIVDDETESGVKLANNAITAAKIAVDAIGADEIAAGAVTKIQNGLATPTNITAGTITTVTNLANLPTMPADWITASGLKADAVTKIATGVWASATRTLSSFGTLVSDIWGAATRTLSAFGFTVATNSDANVTAIKAKTDNLPASPAAVGSAMTLTVGERTAIANEVESQIIDDTDAEKVLKAITDKIASVNPSLDDLTLAGIASAVRTELTTELARIDAAISTRLATAGYTAPANADISTIKSKTNNLPASPAASGEYTSALSAIQADLDNPNQYKADVSGLATTTHLQEVEDKVDGLSGLGIGSEVWQYTLLDNNGVPIADAYIEVTSDDAGIIKLDRGITNAGGVATFHLDPGTVYVWRYKYGYAGDNPDIETVP